jgi:hypothetical protein
MRKSSIAVLILVGLIDAFLDCSQLFEIGDPVPFGGRTFGRSRASLLTHRAIIALRSRAGQHEGKSDEYHDAENPGFICC